MIREVSIDNNEWDSIVKSFNQHDVYYLSGYVKPFQNRNEGTPILLYYEDGASRGMNVVMKRDISDIPPFSTYIEKNTLFDICTPYGYGGWIVQGEEKPTFINEYENWCAENNIVSEFVRFHPMICNNQGITEELYSPVFLGNTISIELDSEENIWNRFSSKNRGHIRKAIKSGVVIQTSNDAAAYMEFQNIYKTTMDHDEASPYYYFEKEFFDSIRNELPDNSLLFTAYYEGVAIASSIMLFANGYMNYHLSGQLYEYRKYAGTNLLLYEAALWGLKNGMKSLHLGGGVGAQEGPLYTFKKSFNTKSDDRLFYIGKRVFDSAKYKDLCAKKGIMNPETEGFFPAYRKY